MREPCGFVSRETFPILIYDFELSEDLLSLEEELVSLLDSLLLPSPLEELEELLELLDDGELLDFL